MKWLGKPEVRMVMHVLQQEFVTRTSFKSLAQIMVKSYGDATAIMRKQERRLPPWSAIKRAAHEVVADHSSSVPELDMSGEITDESLKNRGLEEGSLVNKEVIETRPCSRWSAAPSRK